MKDAQLFALVEMAVAKWLVRDFKTQELVNRAWAFAKTGSLAVQLFIALAMVAEWWVGGFKPQELSTMI